ncbi:hypothetical protein A2U01_0066481, partial [Trifolium medium]|nr:hypothetical protein [Trifolium medium]
MVVFGSDYFGTAALVVVPLSVCFCLEDFGVE